MYTDRCCTMTLSTTWTGSAVRWAFQAAGHARRARTESKMPDQAPCTDMSDKKGSFHGFTARVHK